MAMSQSQQHWLRTRKGLLERIKSRVNRQLGPPSQELGPYVEAYKKEFRGAWKPSHISELLKTTESADVVLGGDFHAFAQAQRTHLRLLRALPRERPVILALECVESRHQKHIDDYLCGKIQGREFLKKTEWDKRWGFPWSFYKPLFQLAKKRRFKIVGVNRYFSHRSTITLKKRDKHAAKIILQAHKKKPTALIYAIFGDLHLAEPHLPQELKKLSVIRVFQNSEKLYFKLARQGLENKVHILKKSRERFCVLGSPPWVKWQSYQMFLEKVDDRDLDENEEFDFTDHVQEVIQFVATDLRIKVKGHDFNAFTAGHEAVWRNIKKDLKGAALGYAEEFIKNNESFYLAKSKLMYISQPTINHASHLVGQYFQAHLSGRTKNLWNVPHDFDGLIWIEACGYLISKIVNHRRKAESLRTIKRRLENMSEDHQAYEVLLLVLEHQMRDLKERKGGARDKASFRPKKKESYFSAAQILGSHLGEALYFQYRKKGRSRKLILNYLKQDVSSSQFRSFYLKTLSQLQYRSITSTREGF